jgi:hypothetical protein
MSVVYQVKFSIIFLAIIVIGLIGNIINLCVFFQKKTTRKNSTYKYLFYLAISDIFVLLISATDSLSAYGYSITLRLYSSLTCKLHTFLAYFLTHMSSLILMVVCIDRSIIICQKNSINNNLGCLFKNVNKVMLYLIVFLVAINAHFILFLSINNVDHHVLTKTVLNEDKYDHFKMLISSYFHTEELIENNTWHFFICYPLDDEKYQYFLINIWLWIDVFIYSLIPFIVMSICSILITMEIKSKSKGFIKTCKSADQTQNNQIIRLKSKRRNRKLTLMLLFNNLFFILCSLPFRLNLFYYKYKGEKDETYSFQAYFHVLAYSNNSLNFIFHFIFSYKYRQLISNLFLNKSNTNNHVEPIAMIISNNLLKYRVDSARFNRSTTIQAGLSSPLGVQRKKSLLTDLNDNKIITYKVGLDLDQIDFIDNE